MNVLNSTLGGTEKPKDFATFCRSNSFTSKVSLRE